MNCNFYLYDGLDNEASVFKIEASSSCTPGDGLTRKLIFNYNTVLMGDGETSNSNILLSTHYENIVQRRNLNDHPGSNKRAAFVLAYDVEIEFNNNTFSGILGSTPLVYFDYLPTFTSKNDKFVNSSDYQSSLFKLENVKTISISNLQASNSTLSWDSDNSFINIYPMDTLVLTLDGLNFNNLVIDSSSMINLWGENNEVTIVNSVFEDITMNDDIPLISIPNVDYLLVQNLNFSKIVQYEDAETYMLRIRDLNQDSDKEFLIQNIQVSESTSGFFKLNSVIGSSGSSKVLKMDSITYQNWNFDESISLISIESIMTTIDFSILITEIHFSNITFATGGFLIQMESHMPNGLSISNSTATNITSGYIKVAATNSVFSVPARLILHNFTASYIDTTYYSFIILENYGRVEISSSLFQYINSYEEGAVLFAGQKETLATISSSIFQYNAAFQGGVFFVEDQSKVIMHDWVVKNNFGVDGGIAWARSGGYFEFYNVSLTNNYAISLPIWEIFDSATSSQWNRWTISNNEVIGNDEFFEEINERCDKLWFLSTKFKDYARSHANELDVVHSNYLFQLIRGGLIMTNGTTVAYQSGIIDSFSSEFSIINSSFLNLTLNDASFKITESNATIENLSVTLASLGSSSHYEFISATTQSELSISGLNFTDGSVPLIYWLQSSITMDSLLLQNITTSDHIITIDQG
jgi:hypothetical protein